jgi:hypothetical protein
MGIGRRAGHCGCVGGPVGFRARAGSPGVGASPRRATGSAGCPVATRAKRASRQRWRQPRRRQWQRSSSAMAKRPRCARPRGSSPSGGRACQCHCQRAARHWQARASESVGSVARAVAVSARGAAAERPTPPLAGALRGSQPEPTVTQPECGRRCAGRASANGGKRVFGRLQLEPRALSVDRPARFFKH